MDYNTVQPPAGGIYKRGLTMGLFGFFKKQPTNSLDSLSEQKKMFLVNYLGDRSVTWHIDKPVKEQYPDVEQNIEDLQKAGLIKKEKGVYVLTESGQEMRKAFRAQERARRKEMHQSAVDFALSGDYLSAYNARAKYEKESVIPHGISVNLGGGSNTPAWEAASEIPYNIQNYIGNSCKLDFSDCENSERFKEALRRFYIGIEATGSNRIDIPDDFEEKLGEKLNCPALDAQLAEKCQFPDPPKLKIYFRTKVRVFNYISTKLIKKWDGNFDLGVYDCTSPLHATMAQYERMKTAGIEGFPKTFKTFEKHKKENSEKYKLWMAEYRKTDTSK